MRGFLYKIRKALWPKLVILCYHRIENYTSDPVKITVSKNNFLKQIDFLKEFANIINPDQFESLKKRKNLPNVQFYSLLMMDILVIMRQWNYY